MEHLSVLLEEAVTALDINPHGNYVDATFGNITVSPTSFVTSTLDINTIGNINIKAKDINIESGNFLLNATTKIQKALSLDVGLTVKSLINALGGCKGC